MRLLFVKLKHIGDALLLTPTLTAVRAEYPEAEIWVTVRRGTEGILAGCPAIDQLLTTAEPEAARRSPLNWWQDLQTIRQLRRQRFDYAFELTDGDRGRWVVALSGARHRCVNAIGRPLHAWWRLSLNQTVQVEWQTRHRVEKDYATVDACLRLPAQVPPLSFARERSCVPVLGQRTGAYAVVHPGTRWRRKRWPAGKWIELGQFLLAGLPQIVLSVGPDPEERALAAEIQTALGPAALSTDGKLAWAELAGLLYEARLFVGVDTAAMHLAAACQCPTVALFGPSEITAWRPWKVPHRIVGPEDGVREQRAPTELTAAIEVSAVVRACEELLGA